MRFLILISVVLSGCVSFTDIPVAHEIYEPEKTIVAETTKLKLQTISKGTLLKKYSVTGQYVYCYEDIVLDEEMPRCFGYENGMLVSALHPIKFTFTKLIKKVPIEKIMNK